MRKFSYKQREEVLSQLSLAQSKFDSEGLTDEVINLFRGTDCGNLDDIDCDDDCPAEVLCDEFFSDEEEIEEEMEE